MNSLFITYGAASEVWSRRKSKTCIRSRQARYIDKERAGRMKCGLVAVGRIERPTRGL